MSPEKRSFLHKLKVAGASLGLFAAADAGISSDVVQKHIKESEKQTLSEKNLSENAPPIDMSRVEIKDTRVEEALAAYKKQAEKFFPEHASSMILDLEVIIGKKADGTSPSPEDAIAIITDRMAKDLQHIK